MAREKRSTTKRSGPGVVAVGITSNKATSGQIEKLVRFAERAGSNQALLIPDCDEEGEAGLKDLLWTLIAEYCVVIRLACSNEMFHGKFARKQPEEITEEEWRAIIERIRQSVGVPWTCPKLGWQDGRN